MSEQALRLVAPLADGLQALARLRKEARDEIARLIDFLDSTIDCDEDSAVDDAPIDDDELGPSLDAMHGIDQTRGSIGYSFAANSYLTEDLEDEHDGREPSLGSSEPLDPKPFSLWFGKLYRATEEDHARVFDQSNWFHGCDDKEREGDGLDNEVGEDEIFAV